MVSEIRIYYEGHKSLKEGFNKFFRDLRERAAKKDCAFRLVTGGSGSNACRDFDIALRSHPTAWNILLTDSEGQDTDSLADSVCQKYGWSQPDSHSIFWMVEMMEAWFHADKDALKKFYGQKFRESALKQNPNVEKISKADLTNGLKAATKDTDKGDYFDHKTRDGPQLLALIDPVKVQEQAPHCVKLFAAVRDKLST